MRWPQISLRSIRAALATGLTRRFLPRFLMQFLKWRGVMVGARQFPSIKKALFKLHRDLQVVIEGSNWWFGRYDLTDIEVLVLLLEDRRYFQHKGVDWRSVLRECFRLMTFRKHGGASTIDMQFVRTKTGFKERTLKRKLYEMLLSYFLQFRMGKLEILRSYLSIVYLGWGIRGVEQAARIVFNRYLWELNREELAMIAAMMVYPFPKVQTERWKKKVGARAQYGLRLFARHAGRYKQRLE